MHPMLNIAIRAVRQGGTILAHDFDSQNIFLKKNPEYLKKIEKTIFFSYQTMKNIIFQTYPTHYICQINKNFKKNKIKKIQWLINPLHGIENFKNNFPHFCISIAIIINFNLEVSVIYDPLKNELFTAVKGRGAQLNGYRIRCNNDYVYKKIIIGINQPFNCKKNILYYQEIFRNFHFKNIYFRCTGSKMLDLAYFSSGRLDGLCYFNLINISDYYMAGILQVQESGGLIRNFYEKNNFLEKNSILIGNSSCLKKILDNV
ncbi:inositol monophosphatase family protein [Buchnera aphidicola (Mindarus keteleerifoliae)]|uniref:inositol monophosphatase family protein n=1 Tax=Buchnera aphidicola TaxID=9 RepID=UPI0031B6AEC3